jgi:hypothetical protein
LANFEEFLRRKINSVCGGIKLKMASSFLLGNLLKFNKAIKPINKKNNAAIRPTSILLVT